MDSAGTLTQNKISVHRLVTPNKMYAFGQGDGPSPGAELKYLRRIWPFAIMRQVTMVNSLVIVQTSHYLHACLTWKMLIEPVIISAALCKMLTTTAPPLKTLKHITEYQRNHSHQQQSTRSLYARNQMKITKVISKEHQRLYLPCATE